MEPEDFELLDEDFKLLDPEDFDLIVLNDVLFEEDLSEYEDELEDY